MFCRRKGQAGDEAQESRPAGDEVRVHPGHEEMAGNEESRLLRVLHWEAGRKQEPS